MVQLYSFSKSYAIPGHRLGAVTAGAPLLTEITKALDCMTICPPRVAQGPVAWAVEGTRPWRAEVRANINARAALFHQLFPFCFVLLRLLEEAVVVLLE